MVGYHNGSISISNMKLQFMILQGNFTYLGILGVTEGYECFIYNVQTSLQLPTNNSGTHVGVLSSYMLAENWSVINITISNSYIYSQLLTGLLMGYINSGTFSQIYVYSSTANSSGSYNWALSGVLYGDSKGYSVQNTQQKTTVHQCYFENNTIFTNNSVIQATSGGLIGDSQDNNIRIQNVKLILNNISSYGSAIQADSSGLIAFLYDAIIDIINVYISQINLYSNNVNVAFAGGFIAQTSLNYKVQITDSKISNIQINIYGTQFRVGIIFSLTPSVLTATGLRSEGTNSINGAAVNNCGNIQTFNEQNGC
ncbi:Hypothetical_protein [Hexamita inflata]|uniref:Hypothetical_protein n=1 Tax=Hexamita inflata TaxID=28002 RepID=A0AA86Q3G2_9EUKA|nr:Hypothetical protein HINF_LOCUS32529 [Hexamita inflata]